MSNIAGKCGSLRAEFAGQMPPCETIVLDQRGRNPRGLGDVHIPGQRYLNHGRWVVIAQGSRLVQSRRLGPYSRQRKRDSEV
jgi:hypothetical protein